MLTIHATKSVAQYHNGLINGFISSLSVCEGPLLFIIAVHTRQIDTSEKFTVSIKDRLIAAVVGSNNEQTS